jgi:hypothetical protein
MAVRGRDRFGIIGSEANFGGAWQMRGLAHEIQCEFTPSNKAVKDRLRSIRRELHHRRAQ